MLVIKEQTDLSRAKGQRGAVRAYVTRLKENVNKPEAKSELSRTDGYIGVLSCQEIRRLGR